LDPAISKRPWIEDEENTLILVHAAIGNKWAELAKVCNLIYCFYGLLFETTLQVLPGRTDNSIKNHWNASKRRLLYKQELLLHEVNLLSYDVVKTENWWKAHLSPAAFDSFSGPNDKIFKSFISSKESIASPSPSSVLTEDISCDTADLTINDAAGALMTLHCGSSTASSIVDCRNQVSTLLELPSKRVYNAASTDEQSDDDSNRLRSLDALAEVASQFSRTL